MKIAAVSDTHGLHRWVGERARGAYGRDVPELPMADILVHAGDYSGFGTKEETIDFANWLKIHPHVFKIVIAGNHDLYAESNPQETSRIFGSRGIYYLRDSEVVIEGVKFYGTPYVPQFYQWAFMENEEQLVDRYAKIPEDTDVLISHGPPYDVLDKNSGHVRTGSIALRNRIMEVKPKVSIFGHIHEGRDLKWNEPEAFLFGLTSCYNVSFLNAGYKPYGITQPVIDLGD